VNQNAFSEEVVVVGYFDVVDITVRTQSLKFPITSRLENLNTDHPRDTKKPSFFSS